MCVCTRGFETMVARAYALGASMFPGGCGMRGSVGCGA